MSVSVCTSAPLPVERLVERVRGEYLEMPGLRLTPQQAQRLFGLDQMACELVLDALTREKFLHHSGDGRFAQDRSSPLHR